MKSTGASIDAPWWQGDTATVAGNFATALYNADNSTNNVRFAWKTGKFLEQILFIILVMQQMTLIHKVPLLATQ